VKNGIYTEGALLSDYDPRRSGTSVRRCIDERDAIEIAHAIVAPAVEAATAELRSDLARVTAQRDREKKRGDELHNIVAKVAAEGHAEKTRAEKAEAALAATVAEAEACAEGAWAYDDGEAAVMDACRRILAAPSRGEGEL